MPATPPPLDPDAPRTLSTQIASALRDSIGDGTYRPGERLPGTRELAAHYDVAMMTVRAALAALTTEGLLVGRKGVGTYVRTRSPGTSIPVPTDLVNELVEWCDRFGDETGLPVEVADVMQVLAVKFLNTPRLAREVRDKLIADIAGT